MSNQISPRTTQPSALFEHGEDTKQADSGIALQRDGIALLFQLELMRKVVFANGKLLGKLIS